MIKLGKTIKTLILLMFVLFLFAPQILKSQTCGFGCLGLSGVYGGYTLQEYKAEGINSWIKANASINNNIEVGKGEGFRIGANLFRAQFDGYFLTAKGYFQFINEEYNSQAPLLSSVKEDYEFRFNYWGLGIDFGVPVFSIVDLKIIEAGITFLNVELKKTRFNIDGSFSESKIENTKLDIGYYLGSGIIINIIPDYISLEGTATYNVYKVDEFMDQNGDKLAVESGTNFIENKGITATVQLNLGFPL